MKNENKFYVKIFTLYLLIFVSFLVKSYTKPNFSMLVSVVKNSQQFGSVSEIFKKPITPHQAR